MEEKISEDIIQYQIVEFYNNNYCLAHHAPRNMIFAIPNGGSRNAMEGMKMKSTGTMPGVSDLIIVELDRIIFCECKAETGLQSKQQIEFQRRVESLGFRYILVRSLEEFKEKMGLSAT